MDREWEWWSESYKEVPDQEGVDEYDRYGDK
jgi:hypothetical protein